MLRWPNPITSKQVPSNAIPFPRPYAEMEHGLPGGTLTDEASLLSVDDSKICFKVAGNSGWLAVEIPSVFSVKGNDYATRVDMTVGTEEKSFDIAKNAWTPVGESADPQGREHMLVEIRSSK